MSYCKLKNFLKEYHLLLLVTIIGFVSWYSFYSANFNGGIQSNDVHVYMDAARNFSRGNGFTLNFMFPGEVYNSKSVIKPLPIILHPAAILVFFKIVGDWLKAAVLASGFFYLLSIPLVFIVTKSFFDKRIAFVTALIIAFDTKSLFSSIFGIADQLFTFLFVLCFYVLYKSERKYHFLLAGLIFGLCCMTRQAGLLFLMPFLLYLFFFQRGKRLSSGGLFVIGYVLTSIVGFCRNYAFYGSISGYANPSGAFLAFTSKFPGRSILKYLEFPGSPLRLILSDYEIFLSFMTKCFHNFGVLYTRFFTDFTSSPYLAALFFTGLFCRISDRKVSELRFLMVGLFFIQLFYGITVQNASRYFYPFTPFIMMFSIWFLFRMVDLLKARAWMRWGIVSIVVLLILYPFSFLSRVDRKHFVSPEIRKGILPAGYEEVGDIIKDNFSENSVIFTDAQWLVGWYGERKAIMLPMSVDMMEEIDSDVVSIDGILLTPRYIKTESSEWRALYYDPAPFGDFLSVKLLRVREGLFVLYKKSVETEASYDPSWKSGVKYPVVPGLMWIAIAGSRHPEEHMILGDFIREYTEEGEIILTNNDRFIEWYVGNIAISCPPSLSLFEELRKRFHIDAVYLTSYRIKQLGNEWRTLFDSPHAFGGFNSINIFYLNNRKVVLFRKEMAGGFNIRGIYEAERMHNLVGKRKIDPLALNGRSVYADIALEEPGCMVFGPYHLYPGGKYRASFRLRVDNNATRDKVAVIDVSTGHGRTVIARRAIYGTDFKAEGLYQEFDIEYLVESESELELRVGFRDVVSLWVDRITVKRLSGVSP